VLTDPSLPITGVSSRINFVQLTYQQSFAVLGRTATLQLGAPFTWGTTEGFVEGVFRDASTTGAVDPRVRFAINLRGAPAMDPAAFQQLRAAPRTIVGASMLVQMPLGRYDADRLLNPGTNRWAVKPAVGVIWPIHPTWLFELELGAWLLGDNDEFLGTTREQSPVWSAEFHLVKRIRPGFWASFDANFYTGGRTTVGGTLRADLQRNSRIGGTVLFPFAGRHAVRGSLSFGVVTQSGGDFASLALSWLYGWR
jgi:hypothetical protein